MEQEGHSLRKHKMKYLETGPVQDISFKLFVLPDQKKSPDYEQTISEL